MPSCWAQCLINSPREPYFFIFFHAAHDPTTDVESAAAAGWSSASVAVASEALEHFINILLGPARPPQHLARHVLHVLHGHVVVVGRRIVDVRKPAVVHHCVRLVSMGGEG